MNPSDVFSQVFLFDVVSSYHCFVASEVKERLFHKGDFLNIFADVQILININVLVGYEALFHIINSNRRKNYCQN